MVVPSTFELRQACNGAHSHLDIVIDGRPLAELFSGRLGALPDRVSPLGWSVAGTEEHQALQFGRFLLEAPPDFDEGRNSILVCPECGDLGCGAYSAVFQRKGPLFTWSNFGFQNDHDAGSLELAPYAHIPMLSFDWSLYESQLRHYADA